MCAIGTSTATATITIANAPMRRRHTHKPQPSWYARADPLEQCVSRAFSLNMNVWLRKNSCEQLRRGPVPEPRRGVRAHRGLGPVPRRRLVRGLLQCVPAPVRTMGACMSRTKSHPGALAAERRLDTLRTRTLWGTRRLLANWHAGTGRCWMRSRGTRITSTSP